MPKTSELTASSPATIAALRTALGVSNATSGAALGISIADAGNYFLGGDVEGSLQEVGERSVALLAAINTGDVFFAQPEASAYARTSLSKGRDTVNARDYGSIADGTSHPLSERFASLAAAQAVYPHATALTDEIDWAACQAMVNAVEARGTADPSLISRGFPAFFNAGAFVFNKTLVITRPNLYTGAGRGEYAAVPDGDGRGITVFMAAAGVTDLPLVRIWPTNPNYSQGGCFVGIQLAGTGLVSYCLHVSCTSRWKFDVAAFGARLAGVRSDDANSGVYSFANEWNIHYSYQGRATSQPSHAFWIIGGAAGNPQQIIHSLTGVVYNGDGLRLEDEIDNLICHHTAVSVASPGVGRNVAMVNGAGPSIPRVNVIHTAGGRIFADVGTYGNKVYTSSETTTISGSGQLYYEVIDYVNGGLWKTRHFWMSDTLRLGSNDFTVGAGAVPATQAQIGSALMCWKLSPTEAAQGISTGIAVPKTWGPGYVNRVRIHYAFDATATGGTGLVFKVAVSSAAPNADGPITALLNSTSSTATIPATTFRRHYTHDVVLGTALITGPDHYFTLSIERLGSDVADTVNENVFIIGASLIYEAYGPTSGGSGTFVVPSMGS